ncbi:hypothetical protein MMC10_004084 [Thelotrema lepadinum]|nr:hypothetical protein [Thelotrema lepadinum]
MTAVPRDPSFWKRFSVAAHLDEEIKTGHGSPASSTRPSFKHQDSWLEQQQIKKRRNKYFLWVSGLSFVAIVTLLILVLIWLSKHGFFLHGQPFSFP